MNVFKYLREQKRIVVMATISNNIKRTEEDGYYHYEADITNFQIKNKNSTEYLSKEIELYLVGENFTEVFPKGSILKMDYTLQREVMPIYTLGNVNSRSFSNGQRTYGKIEFDSRKLSEYAKPYFTIKMPEILTTFPTRNNDFYELDGSILNGPLITSDMLKDGYFLH